MPQILMQRHQKLKLNKRDADAVKYATDLECSQKFKEIVVKSIP
jgi:hypothetical protein